MHIFVDESGTFSSAVSSSSVSAVGSLVIPSQKLKDFEKLYGRVRRKLPRYKGEVKGRLLNETQVGEVVNVLSRLGCLFEVVASDSIFHTEEEIVRHKAGQEEGLTINLTDEHPTSLTEQVWQLRRQLERTPPQLYLQACAMSELVYTTLNNANLYYSFRLPQELGSYHWTIDAKSDGEPTPWEKWWATLIRPMIEMKSLKEPFITVEGADYRWHEHLKTQPSAYKKRFIERPDESDWFSLNPLLEDIRFSSSSEYGLEAIDILVNAVRRSLAGNFSREGWLPLATLMIHRSQHYIRLISLSSNESLAPRVPYRQVLSDFRRGGRIMRPARILRSDKAD
jgi:hypothetical protein